MIKSVKKKKYIAVFCRRNCVIISAFLTILFVSAFLSSQEAEVVFDKNFFRNFNIKPVISKDHIFEELTNRIVIGRGTISGISVQERYKRNYRIVINSSDSGSYNHKIIFYVYLENKDTVDLLTLNSKFEFKGQFMGYTPLNSKRNEYIIDVVMMDGSTVIE